MIISGKELSAKLKAEMAAEVATFGEKYGRVPHLVVILVGEDPGSVSYVTGKAKASAEVGIRNTTIRKPATIAEEELLGIIAGLNADPEVDGILVQLPLPKHIDEEKVIAAIDKAKDVDGFHPLNVAALWQKQPCTLPCTPKGIVKMLKAAGVEIAGKRAVVVGRSNIVGLPVSKLLLDENATVTVTHSRTRDLGEVTRGAEILVVAIGRPKFVTADMVSDGAVVTIADASMLDFMDYFQVNLMNPKVLVGVFVGAMMAFLFCGLTMNAVGRAAQSMVNEVRRQFREIKGILTGDATPDYARCVAISTKGAQREMLFPSLLAILVPVAMGLVFGVAGVIGLLVGALGSGFVLAIFMANSGGAWDNAKKYVEEGNMGGKGSDSHKATVVGDTVGDPFKDTSGPSLNILIKLMSMVAIVMAGLTIAYSIF